MSGERIGGTSFNFLIDGIPVLADKVTLSISDGSQVAMTGGVPNGWVPGTYSAEGEMTLDATEFAKISAAALARGSYDQLDDIDGNFIAIGAKEGMLIEAFGMKLTISGLLDADTSSADKSTTTVPFFIASNDFIKINGVPYIKPSKTALII